MDETQQGSPVPQGINEVKKEAGSQSQWSVPGAIIVAGVIVALAIFYSGSAERNLADSGKNTGINEPNNAPQGQNQPSAPAEINIKAISAEDHIFGDVNAPVKVVEYSDLECPFCKRFHATMQQVVSEYNGKVAWVYRHFPIDQLHPKARKEAEATECANDLGGNDAFWKYMNRLMEVTPTNNGLDPAELPKIALFSGLNVAKFNECLSSGKFSAKVEEAVKAAMAAGAQGTPYSVVVSADGKKTVIPGALPFEQVKGIIDAAL